ncbi:MAG: flagellar hook-basal body complex protein [Mariprofundales bacterium]
MGMYSSLYTSKSGMMAFAQGTSVIGDNLANVNSTGYKASTLLFSDVMANTSTGNGPGATQALAGTQLAKIGHDMRQGQVKTTTNNTDMAISGSGMFAVKDSASGQNYYSRAGGFFLDKNYQLINGQGLVVQGWQKDATGATVGTAPTDINIATFAGASAAALVNNQLVIPATATSQLNIGVTLAATAQRPSNPLFDPNDPTSFNSKVDIPMYDANGTNHVGSMFFVKQGLDASGNTAWDWHVAIKGDEVTGGSASDADTLVEMGGPSYGATGAVPAGTLPSQTTIAPGTQLSAAVTSSFTLTDQRGNSAVIPANGTNSWLAGKSLATVAAANGLANAGLYHIGSGGVTVPAATVGGSSPMIQQPATISTVTSGIADPATATAQRLEFGPQGALVNEYAPTLTIPWSGVATPGSVALNMGSATTLDAQGTVGGSGLDGSLQLGGSFASNSITGDGFAQGTLEKLGTDSTGVIQGTFTNGRTLPLAQVALASFGNPSALERVGNNLLQASQGSGIATLLAPESSGMGTIVGNGLEQSNVDLGGEFVKLIVLQRGYEANSKSLTTTDQMLTLLAQLKR